MTERINEDIRFYLPADPYYYQVDNLPLEDLVTNDIRLQDQIDELRVSDVGETISRSGFSELQPFIDDGIPGTVTVRPGSFIGRTQRTADGTFVGGANVLQFAQGIPEMNTPPTIPGEDYSTGNPPNVDQHGANQVGRTSFFQFNGGSVPIESFDFNGFENRSDGTETNPPAARIDLIGITTVEGAFDDPFVPGNDTGAAITGDGHPKLCVVKGCGLINSNGNKRTVKIGEKYITLANPTPSLNAYGRDFEGNIVSDPEFGTVPSPDDVINVCVSRNDIQEPLQDWVNNNVNSSFFLPLAYVFVPQTHVEGNNIPSEYLKDIRPFFRTAELSISERQAVAASINPSVQNPFVTTNQFTNEFDTQIQWNQQTSIQNQINDIVGGSLPNFVGKEFQFKTANTTTVDGVRFGWTFMIVNGMWIGHGRAEAIGFTQKTCNFNLYNWGLDNQNGAESAMAIGGIYAAGDIEEGHFGYSVGSNFTSNRSSTVFTGDGTFKWTFRAISKSGDNLRVYATVIGKARDNFNLENADW
tara:strand:- start:130 stop:1713 length:1584 start_codon:yes stop_codon:yes gene_type:complete